MEKKIKIREPDAGDYALATFEFLKEYKRAFMYTGIIGVYIFNSIAYYRSMPVVISSMIGIFLCIDRWVKILAKEKKKANWIELPTYGDKK